MHLYVAFACALVEICSAPGHTFGVNEYIDSFIEDLGTSRNSVSGVWMFASFFSASLVVVVARLMDKWSTRKVLAVVAPTYILVLVLMRFVTNVVPELVILMSFMRLLGPECLILISRSTLNRWFVEQRGKASALMSVPTGVIFMTQSILVSYFIKTYGWRNSYSITALILTPCLLIGLVFLRDSPESMNLKPDISWSNKKNENSKGKYMTVSSSDVEMTAISSSDVKDKNEEDYTTVDVTIESAAVDESVSELKATTTTTTTTTSLEGLTLSQTTRTAMFWAIALQPASIFWSGMNYHISDHVNLLAGLDATEGAAAVYLPLALCSNIVGFLLSAFLVDRLSVKSRVRVMASTYLFLLVPMLVSLKMKNVHLVRLFGATLGIFEGTNLAFYNIIFSSLFGRKSLAQIRGLATAFGIVFTGIGPLAFSLCKSATGDYNSIIWGLLFVQLATALFLCVVRFPTANLSNNAT